SDFRFLYPLDMPLEEKIRTIATKVYGVSDIELQPEARRALRRIRKLGLEEMPVNMAKTSLSLTDDERIKGLPPEGYVLRITDLRPMTGAGFIVAYCGEINTMPALPTHPAAERMDIDENGRITGLT
ncbi:formate--tetrahydrofolate ligase, partial [Candidatus Bathyarchaeota archaeon]